MAKSSQQNVEMESFEVLNIKDKAQIINFAQSNQASVYFKHETTPVFKTHVVANSSKKIITCVRPENLPFSLNNKTVTVNFVVDQEIYFLVTVVTIDPKFVYFNIDTDFFHLARRKNRRLKIPKDYEALFMVKRLATQMSFLRAIVMDLSKEGCRLSLNTDHPLVCLSDTIEGTLKLGDRPSVDMKGVVRYHKLVSNESYKQTFGVQFVDLTLGKTETIEKIVMDLQRELFLRMLE